MFRPFDVRLLYPFELYPRKYPKEEKNVVHLKKFLEVLLIIRKS